MSAQEILNSGMEMTATERADLIECAEREAQEKQNENVTRITNYRVHV